MVALSITAPALSQTQEFNGKADTTVQNVPEETVVYGEKNNLDAQDTFSSVGIINASLIEETGLIDSKQVFRLMANVDAPTDSNSGFVIRGVNSEGIGEAGGRAPLASTFIDGAVQSQSSARRGARGLWDVAQVEVFRGSQSTNFGRNSLAGAINIITQDASHEWQSSVRVHANTVDTRDAAFMVNIPVIDDTFALRITGQYLSEDSGIYFPKLDNQLNKKPAEGEYQQFRIKALYQINDDLNIKYSIAHATDEPATTEIDYQLGDSFNYVNNGPYEFRQNTVINQNFTLDYHINEEWQFTSITASSDDDMQRGFYTPSSEGSVPIMGTDGSGGTVNISEELKFHYQSEDTDSYGLIGIYIYQQQQDTTLRTGQQLEDLQLVDTQETNQAIFGNWNYAVNDNWMVHVGTRLDQGKNKGEVIVNGKQDDRYDDNYQVALPSAGITYAFTGEVKLNLDYKRGYRAGGSGLDTQNETPLFYSFEPEFTDTVELALRSQWLQNRLLFNANLFYTKWTDQQVQRTIKTSTNDSNTNSISDYDFVIENIGRSELAGLELDSRLRISSALQFYSSLGFLHTQVLEVASPKKGLGESAGDAFPQSPTFTFVLGGSYQLLDNLQLAFDGKYSNYYYSDIPNTSNNKVDSFFVANASLSYYFYNADVRLYANNLFDETYVTNIDTKYDKANPGEVRHFGAMLTVHF